MNLYTRQAAAFRNELRQSCGTLVGIVQGVLADGQLQDEEVRFLDQWLRNAESVSLIWPGTVIAAQVREVLADGYISPTERAHLVETLQKLIGGTLDEVAETGLMNQLALDENVEVQIAQHSFCFTGDFVFGPRSVCESHVTGRGGRISNVTKSLDYLVVGGMGSAEWKHGSYGLKIEKAVTYREAGVPLRIVHEDVWADALQ